MNSSFAGAVWRKASYSGGGNGQCVEVAVGSGLFGVRDSKDPEGGHIVIGRGNWDAFVADVKLGRFDR